MATFADLKDKTVAWLGHTPTDRRIHVEFSEEVDDGREFWVINGAWDGVLYPEEDGSLCIVDNDYGNRHHPVYIVEIDTKTKVNPVETVEYCL